MWGRFDGPTVRAELEALAALGCTVTRSFCYWPEFMPAPDVIDEQLMERFVDFLDLHEQVGLATIPTFIVGHMSGQNWSPSWREGRDLYRDVWLVSQQAWFVESVARRVAAHPGIAGWLLSNEMPLFGGEGDEDHVTAWARLLTQALRAAGATQPIGTGDGAWGPEVTGRRNGYSLGRLQGVVDFLGPHVYPSSDDPVRQMLAAAFACEMAGTFAKPVVLEEFGLSSDMASGENAAHYYRQVLHSTLFAGARGWIAWNNCDFDSLAAEDPYRHHAFELHFGIIDRNGVAKPQAHELSRFSRLVQALTATGWQRFVSGREEASSVQGTSDRSGGRGLSDVPSAPGGPGGSPISLASVSLVVPEHLENTDSSWSPVPKADIAPNLFQAYIAALEADLPVQVVRERDMVYPTGEEGPSAPHTPFAPAALWLMPCAKLATTQAVRMMLSRASLGATVYASYFAGSTDAHPGPWFPWLNEVFGVEHRLRYGLADEIEDDEVILRFVDQLGDLETGTVLRFPVRTSGRGRSFLPVTPVSATVLAVDGRERPALLRVPKGDGWMVLCTYPIEHLAATRANANPEDTWRLYSALATAAGARRPVYCDDPRVIVRGMRLEGPDAAWVYSASNLSSGHVEAPMVLAPGLCVEPFDAPFGDEAGTGTPSSGRVQLSLGPYEVAVWSVKREG